MHDDDSNLLVRGVRLLDNGVSPTRVDIRIDRGQIHTVADGLSHRRGETVLDAKGCFVIPGLHDHHMHLRSLAARDYSVQVGPDDVSDYDEMADALQRAPEDGSGWRRAVGYHESVAGRLDRHSLDAMVPGARLRVQHRSGALWVLSSAAIQSLALDEHEHPGIERDTAGNVTGRLFRMDDWLADRLPRADLRPNMAEVSQRLAMRGVTGMTDATPDATAASVAELAETVTEGRVVQRLHVMCSPVIALPSHPLVSRGPEKVLLDDDRLPSLDAFADRVRRVHEHGAPVAVHCVTAVQLALTVVALEEAGPRAGDRIEHAAVVPDGLVPRLAALGVSVVTNPAFVRERGDSYLTEVEPREIPELCRCASLVSAGIGVAGGTDAPFGSEDPWAAIAAAHERRTRRGSVFGPREALSLSMAVALFTGDPARPAKSRRIAPGQPGDLCVLTGTDLPAPAGLGGQVAATVVAGRVVYTA